MEKNVINEVSARRFLLGDLSAEDRNRIEELAFEDPDTFALIQAAQDDLFDEFLNDELSSEEKERFQNCFLVQPGRRQDLRIALALQQYFARDEQSAGATTDDSAKARSWLSIFDWFRLRPATVGPVLLILGVAVGLLVVIYTLLNRTWPMYTWQTPPPPAATPSTSPAVTPQATPLATPTYSQGTPTPSPRQSVEPVYAVVLVPGSPARSEGEETKVPPVSRPISLELPLVDGTPYPSYQAVLQKDGRNIRSWFNLQPKELEAGRGIKIVVSGGLLRDRQRYRIILSGASARKPEPIHSYYFIVSN